MLLLKTTQMMKLRLKYLFSSFWKVLFKPLTAGGLKVPVLCYHSVNSLANSHADPLTPELFEAQLKYFAENCTPISLDNFLTCLEGGAVVPENAVVITFDDGYRDNYETVFPLIKKYNIPIAIFVVTSFIDQRIKLIPEESWWGMTWAQVEEMQSSGLVTFGAHTDSHLILSTLDQLKMKQEVVQSKSILEDRLGRKIKYFAYPNGQGGDIPQSAVKTVAECGFRAAFSTFWRTSHSLQQKYCVNRVMISGVDSVDILKRKISGDYDYLYYLHYLKALVVGLLCNRGIFARSAK